MKIIATTLLYFVTVGILYGQTKKPNAKTIYTGYQYSLSDDDYYSVKYSKNYSGTGDEFITTYTIYHPTKGYAAITVTATHYKTQKKIKVSVDDTNESIFSNINEEETTYDTPSLGAMGFAGAMKQLGGKRIPNQLMVKFNNALFEYVRVVHVLASQKGDVDRTVFLILDEKDIPLTKEEQAEIEKRKAIESERQRQEEARRIEEQKQEEAKRIVEEEKRKAEEAEKLRLFLVERRTKVYDYTELNSQNYLAFKNEVEQKIKNGLNDYKKVNYSSIITFVIDSTNAVTIKEKNLKSDNPAFENFLNVLFKKTKLEKAFKNNYSVSSSFDYSLTVKNYTDTFSLENKSSDLTLSKGDANKFEESKKYLQSDLNSKSLPSGKYVMAYSKNQVNDNVNENVKYIKYKGFGGGSANCLLSVLIPGLGNPLVNSEKKGTWLITTFGVAGLVGGGVLMNSLSNSNYQKYLDATKQSDIDNYYDKANLQHHLMYAFIGAGAAWWAIDIIHVCSKGAKNKKKNNEAKSKMNLALYPSFQNNSYVLGINVKF